MVRCFSFFSTVLDQKEQKVMIIPKTELPAAGLKKELKWDNLICYSVEV